MYEFLWQRLYVVKWLGLVLRFLTFFGGPTNHPSVYSAFQLFTHVLNEPLLHIEKHLSEVDSVEADGHAPDAGSSIRRVNCRNVHASLGFFIIDILIIILFSYFLTVRNKKLMQKCCSRYTLLTYL